MPFKKRIDQRQVEKALSLIKEMVGTKNQSDFAELANAIVHKFGGTEGISNLLFLQFQSAKTWTQQLRVLELIVKIASRKAEMGGSLEALEKAIPLLSDDDLEEAALSITLRAIEKSNVLEIDSPPSGLTSSSVTLEQGP